METTRGWWIGSAVLGVVCVVIGVVDLVVTGHVHASMIWNIVIGVSLVVVGVYRLRGGKNIQTLVRDSRDSRDSRG